MISTELVGMADGIGKGKCFMKISRWLQIRAVLDFLTWLILMIVAAESDMAMIAPATFFGIMFLPGILSVGPQKEMEKRK